MAQQKYYPEEILVEKMQSGEYKGGETMRVKVRSV